VIENVLERLGGLEEAWLIGDFARGKDSQVIDLVLVGNDLNMEVLLGYIARAEELSGRKIRYLILHGEEKGIIESQFPVRLLLFTKSLK